MVGEDAGAAVVAVGGGGTGCDSTVTGRAGLVVEDVPDKLGVGASLVMDAAIGTELDESSGDTRISSTGI